MSVSGIALAAITITIGTPIIGDARVTHPGTPTTRIERGPSEPPSRGHEDAAPDPAPIDLVIEVRDLARVPQGIMRETRAEVEHTFLEIGVRIIWTDLDRTPRNESALLRLFVVGSTLPAVLSDENPPAATLGLAPESGTWAQVFYGRVAAAVARRQVSTGVALAHVMAHELGHVLLPPNSHSRVGVMRPTVDLDHPTFRRFTAEQAHLIRAALSSGRRYAWHCSQ